LRTVEKILFYRSLAQTVRDFNFSYTQISLSTVFTKISSVSHKPNTTHMAARDASDNLHCSVNSLRLKTKTY